MCEKKKKLEASVLVDPMFILNIIHSGLKIDDTTDDMLALTVISPSYYALLVLCSFPLRLPNSSSSNDVILMKSPTYYNH
jgi:hypothetical protein